MNILILPGFSIKNRIWLEETDKYLSREHLCISHEWKHWQTGNNGDFSIEKEIPIIKKQIHAFSEVCIVAKSIGSYVASFLLKDSHITFPKIIFCGLPLTDLNQLDQGQFKNNLSGINIDTFVCFQNSKDPHGGYDEARVFLTEINMRFKVVMKDGDTHDYPYYEEFKEFLVKAS
jgi:hypothetical protein